MNEWKGIVRAIRTVRLHAVRIILGYIFIAFKSRGVGPKNPCTLIIINLIHTRVRVSTLTHSQCK